MPVDTLMTLAYDLGPISESRTDCPNFKQAEFRVEFLLSLSVSSCLILSPARWSGRQSKANSILDGVVRDRSAERHSSDSGHSSSVGFHVLSGLNRSMASNVFKVSGPRSFS